MSTLAGEPQETTINCRDPLRNLLLTPFGLFSAQRLMMSLYYYDKTIIERWDNNSHHGLSNRLLNESQ